MTYCKDGRNKAEYGLEPIKMVLVVNFFPSYVLPLENDTGGCYYSHSTAQSAVSPDFPKMECELFKMIEMGESIRLIGGYFDLGPHQTLNTSNPC